MGQELKNIKHLYTTDFFQRSSFTSSDQIISVYYIVELKNKVVNKIKEPLENQPFFIWEKIDSFDKKKLEFPIDQFLFKNYITDWPFKSVVKISLK